MRAVIYSDDLEPLTVIEVEPWMMRHFERRDPVILTIDPKVSAEEFYTPPDYNEIPKSVFKQVEIRSEIFIRNDKKHVFLFTDSKSSALLLKPVLLPGQESLLLDNKEAYGDGFSTALSLMQMAGLKKT